MSFVGPRAALFNQHDLIALRTEYGVHQLIPVPLCVLNVSAKLLGKADVGTLIMCGLEKNRVIDAVKVIVSQYNKLNRVMNVVPDYEAGPVSKQALRVVLSYVDYVNRTVWSK